MHTFKDKNGNEWNFELNLLNAKRIEQIDFTDIHPKGLKTIHIVNMSNEQESISLFMDAGILAAIVYYCCPADRDRLGIKTHEAFCELLDGQSIDRMREAVWGELGSFFTHLRTTFQTLSKRFSAVAQEVDKLATQQAEQILTTENLAKEMQTLKTGMNGTSSI